MNTPQINQVSQLLRSFSDAISGISEIAYVPLHHKLRSLNDRLSTNDLTLHAAILLDEGDTGTYEKLATWLDIPSDVIISGRNFESNGIVFHFRQLNSPPANKIGDLQPEILIIAADIAACIKQYSSDYLSLFTRQKAIVLAWQAEGSFAGKLSANDHIICRSIGPEDISIKDIIREKGGPEYIKAYAAILQAEESVAALSEILARENAMLLLKKTQQAQSNILLRKIDEMKYAGNDAISVVKGNVQLVFNELKRKIKNKYDDLNKSQVSDFSNFIHQKQSEIGSFEEKPNIEKHEKLVLSFPAQYEMSLQNGIHNVLSRKFKEDIAELGKNLDKANSEISPGAQNINSLSHANIVAQTPSPADTITNYGKLSKTFQGEATKKGFMEYFIAIRDYTTQISVVTGLLMPLVIIVNSLQIFEGDNKPARAEQVQVASGTTVAENEEEHASFRSIASTVRYTINLLTGIITIIMIFVGFYFLRKTIPKKRLEEKSRELVKAKEYVASECRKIFNEATREWTAVLLAYLDDVYLQYTRSIESISRDNAGQAAENVSSEKLFLQRIQANLDNEQKKISMIERQRDDFRKNIGPLKRDIQKLYSS